MQDHESKQSPQPTAKPADSLAGVEAFALKLTKWVGSSSSLVVHTIMFALAFVLVIAGVPVDRVLLVLTTIVSLEAIYLSIFIQMSVNRSESRLDVVSKSVAEIEKDMDEIQVDIDEIQEDVEGIGEDVDEIQKDIEGIEEDIDEIQEDIEEELDPKKEEK